MGRNPLPARADSVDLTIVKRNQRGCKRGRRGLLPEETAENSDGLVMGRRAFSTEGGRMMWLPMADNAFTPTSSDR
jgi:hypothetical protein